MALGSPSPKRDASENWARLEQLIAEQSAQVALLNKAKVPPGTQAIYEAEGTKGRDGKPGIGLPRSYLYRASSWTP